MRDGLGSIIDRLITADLKLWAVQDIVHKAAAAGEGLDAETVQNLSSLNLERNRLMTAVDVCLKEAVSLGPVVDDHVKIL
jgi:hypothetical protein